MIRAVTLSLLACLFVPVSAAEPVVKVPPVYSTRLPICDRVEVIRLGDDVDVEQAGKDTYHARGGEGAYFKIVARKELKGEEVEKLSGLWRGLTFDLWAQAMCHIPGYALRFYKGDQLEFETSVCFGCSNFSHPLSKGGVALHGFKKDDARGKALREFLAATFPEEKKPEQAAPPK